MNAPNPSTGRHLDVLDGWRGISILCVLTAHLLPLGPKAWSLNETVAPMGMALFFTLSGFLITRFLLGNSSVGEFLVRRFFRIIPLAWLALAIALPLTHTVAADYLPNFLFYANLPPFHLTDIASHFWSLGVEMQFYVGVALIVAMFGRRGLYALPALCVAVTLNRIATGAEVDIVTWRRIDEILAGGILALAYSDRLGAPIKRAIGGVNSYLLLALLAASSHPASGPLNYLRPYFAAMLVGSTLLSPPAGLRTLLCSRTLRYIAAISFALYVIHHLLMYSWLGSGEKLEKYLKRPVLIAVTFGLAHLSTYQFEQRWMDLGKRLSDRLRQRRIARAG